MAKNQLKVGQNKSHLVSSIPLACAEEAAAVELMESQRWGDNPTCAHCESANVYKMVDAKTGERSRRYLWRCRDCKKQYTVRIGTVFEESRIPMRHWCYAFWRACTSKKGVAALEIQRQTGLSYKSALFMMHRIRFAMTPTSNEPKLNGIVESDEVWLGGRGNRKIPVVVLVARGGELRAERIRRVTTKNLRRVMQRHVDRSTSHLVTDDAKFYRKLGREFGHGHHYVRHSYKEYARMDVTPQGVPVNVHVNNAESFFAILRRGLHGIWHSVSEKHLHRYINAAQFRFNHRKLVHLHSWICGYNRFSLIRASSVVYRQFTGLRTAFRSRSHAPISLTNVGLSGILRSRLLPGRRVSHAEPRAVAHRRCRGRHPMLCSLHVVERCLGKPIYRREFGLCRKPHVIR